MAGFLLWKNFEYVILDENKKKRWTWILKKVFGKKKKD